MFNTKSVWSSTGWLMSKDQARVQDPAVSGAGIMPFPLYERKDSCACCTPLSTSGSKRFYTEPFVKQSSNLATRKQPSLGTEAGDSEERTAVDCNGLICQTPLLISYSHVDSAVSPCSFFLTFYDRMLADSCESIMNLRAGNFSSSLETIIFPTRTSLHKVI
jgi:hypothetical protein